MSRVPRRICYVTGSRADFGLMSSTLHAIESSPGLELTIVATGMHLSERHGNTVRDIEREGFLSVEHLELDLLQDGTGASMARNIGAMMCGFVGVFEVRKPEIVLLLGDRGEMLAAAVAAIHLNIPIAHIHGGERSGTVDEPVRHAISKLAHIHLVATDEARDRLCRLGEQPDSIWVAGAPGLDGLLDLASISREELFSNVGFEVQSHCALLVYHPVLQNEKHQKQDAQVILDLLAENGLQTIALMPNSDAGSEAIRAELSSRAGGNLQVFDHLPRADFVSWMANCDVMIGNSSSGIIEAASFGTPVMNIGSRQNLRQRNSNVVDVNPELDSLRTALQQALQKGKVLNGNVYGDGNAASRIVSVLVEHELPSSLMNKINAH